MVVSKQVLLLAALAALAAYSAQALGQVHRAILEQNEPKPSFSSYSAGHTVLPYRFVSENIRDC